MVVEVQKIDSSFTEMRIAEEASLGVLPGTPLWITMEPNGYTDTGGNVGGVARRPITTKRLRKKGTTTIVSAGAGANIDLTPTMMTQFWPGMLLASGRLWPQHGGRFVIPNPVTVVGTGYDIGSDAATAGYGADLLVWAEGFADAANNGLKVLTGTATDVALFAGSVVEASPPADASIRVVGYEFPSADLDVVNAGGSLPTILSTASEFANVALQRGDWIWIGGTAAASKFVNAENNGLARVRSVTAGVLTLDKAPGGTDLVTDFTAETGTGLSIRIFLMDVYGTVASDAATFVDRTYTIERLLGKPNPVAAPTITQGESVSGCQWASMTVNVPLPGDDSKVTFDVNWLGTDNAQRAGTGPDPLLSATGNVVAIPSTDVFNPAGDVLRLKLNIVPPDSDGNGAADPLFARITQLTMALSNNSVANNSVGSDTAFAITANLFTADISLTAYFADIAAQQAVRNNSDTELELVLAKVVGGTHRQAVLFDFPLGALKGGLANVEQDAPVTVPLEFADGEDEGLGRSFTVGDFGYIPLAA
jgi:hypothetical protein